MPDFLAVAKLDELPDGGLKRVVAHGQEICLSRIGQEVYAVSDVCTNARASLAAGYLDEYLVECPRHGCKFDVRTGEVKAFPAVKPVRTYQVRIIDGSIEIATHP